MSFREVATVMFEEGDVERANRYLKRASPTPTFYSAMMRNAQSSKVLPVIDDAYAQLQDRLASRLCLLALATTVLAVVLVIFILPHSQTVPQPPPRQCRGERRQRRAQRHFRTPPHGQQRAPRSANHELRDFNRTKEQYAGLFMEYCSSATPPSSTIQQPLACCHTGRQPSCPP